MHILETNRERINNRMVWGLEFLKKHYNLVELDTREFNCVVINGMEYHVSQYLIEGVGNLLVMTCVDGAAIQMDSFVITPYLKDLPLFSTDYIYVNEKRNFLNEFYNLTGNSSELYTKYLDIFKTECALVEDMTDMAIPECWYDDLRPVYVAKNTTVENDDRIFELFQKNLEQFVAMEKESPTLSKEEYDIKHEANKNYCNGLVDNGGVSTDVFKAVMGPEKTKEFFNTIFFAPDLY